VGKGDQRAENRKAGDEGAGAVDRIDHPGVVSAGVVFAQFLAKDSVIGIGLDDEVADRLFGLAVGAGDGLLGAGRGRLVLDRVVGAEMGNDYRARRVRQAFAKSQVLVEPFGIVGQGGLLACR